MEGCMCVPRGVPLLLSHAIPLWPNHNGSRSLTSVAALLIRLRGASFKFPPFPPYHSTVEGGDGNLKLAPRRTRVICSKEKKGQ